MSEITIENLAEMKRAATLGRKLRITNHDRPVANRVADVTRESTVDLIMRAWRENGDMVERSHVGWGKAGEWQFDGTSTVHRLSDGKPFLTIEILADDDPTPVGPLTTTEV